MRQGNGLIAFTSSSGSVHYCVGPADGAPKVGLDKLAANMAVGFAGRWVAAVSIWMGALATERLLAMIDAERAKYGYLADALQTPEFIGHVIWALSCDPALAELSGQTVIGAEMGVRYNLKDQGDRIPPSARDTHKVAPREQYKPIIR